MLNAVVNVELLRIVEALTKCLLIFGSYLKENSRDSIAEIVGAQQVKRQSRQMQPHWLLARTNTYLKKKKKKAIWFSRKIEQQTLKRENFLFGSLHSRKKQNQKEKHQKEKQEKWRISCAFGDFNTIKTTTGF